MLISNEEFKIKEIPNYHPASQRYLAFWQEEKRKCIEGVWVSGKWMPGKLYWYINYGTIKLNKSRDKVKSLGKPLLRDLEWALFLHWTEARGFSGFDLDKEYTCLEIVKELRDLGEDSPSPYLILEYPSAINPDTGKLKKYVPAREYLFKIHDGNYGKALFENNAKNLLMLGARGYGKSYSLAGIITHEYLFDGHTEYDRFNKTSAEIVVGAGDAKYSTETLSKVKLMIENLPGAQEIGGKYFPAPFFKRYSGTWAPASQITSGYKKKIGGQWVTMGSGSNIKHRTFRDNPFAANGTRPGIMLFEEIGMFDNLKESYVSSVECQREGSRKFGSMMFIGTGGDMNGGGTLDAQEMFYNPIDYDCLVFQDEWEFRGKIGYFIPAYLGLHDYKDLQGNTRIAEAREYLDKEREKLRRTKGSSTALEGEMTNRPIVPSEMFLQRAGAIFPIPELRRRLEKLAEDNIQSLIETPVQLYFDPDNVIYNGVNYKVDTKKELRPINNFPWKDLNREGCTVVYELPQLIDGKVPQGAYIIGHDPYGSDSVDGESLGAIVVMKTKKYASQIGHDEIVAVYYGRPWQGRQIVNETLYKLARFYNAKIYFENVRGNVKEYFEKIKRLDMLALKPQTVLTKRASYTQSHSLEYGYPMSSRDMKIEIAQYGRDWLLEERSTDDEGNVIRNLDRIWDKFLIQQLIAFNLDGNFDAVMGWLGCVIGMNETYNQYINKTVLETEHNFDKEIKSVLVFNRRIFQKI